MKKLVLLIFVVFYLIGCGSENPPPEVIYVYVYDTDSPQVDTGLPNEDVIDSGSSVIDIGQVVDSGGDTIGVYDIGFDAGYDIVDTYQGGVEDVYDVGHDSGSVADINCVFCRDAGNSEDIRDVVSYDIINIYDTGYDAGYDTGYDTGVEKPLCDNPKYSCMNTCGGEIKDSVNNGYTHINKCYYDYDKKCWYRKVEKCGFSGLTYGEGCWTDKVCYQDGNKDADCMNPRAMPYCYPTGNDNKDCRVYMGCMKLPDGGIARTCYWDSELKCWKYWGYRGCYEDLNGQWYGSCKVDADGFPYCTMP